MREWRTIDHLTGKQHAAQRSALYGLADAADAAEHHDTSSPYAVAMTVERFLRAVDEHAPPPAPPDNPYEVTPGARIRVGTPHHLTRRRADHR